MCEIGGLESAGVVFVLRLVLLVGRLGVGGEGGGGEQLQLALQADHDPAEELAFVHGRLGWGLGRRMQCGISRRPQG